MTFNTVVSGTTITATWGNQVRDQQVSVFASIAALLSAVTSPVQGMLCYVADTDLFWRYNGAKWMRQAKTTQVTTQQSYTTTTMTDIPGWSFNADINSAYAFYGWVHTVAPTANDLSLQWVLPGAATIEWTLLGPASTDAGTSLTTTVYQGVITTAGPLTIGGMNSTGCVGQVIGSITTGGTSGTCKMQGAQAVAGGTSFIRNPSWLTIEQTT